MIKDIFLGRIPGGGGGGTDKRDPILSWFNNLVCLDSMVLCVYIVPEEG